MSNGSNVPPTRGTEPRINGSRERRYREEPGIYARFREQGSHPFTLGEVDARIIACASDQASSSGSGELDPPLFWELEEIFWHRLYRDLPADREAMAAFGGARSLATARQNAARENRVRFERRRRELESMSLRAGRPVTGLTLSRPWFLVLFLAPAALIEVIGSTPSVQQAFKLPIGWSILFAFAISAVLVLVAEQLGNALAAVSQRSRRMTTAVAALLLLAAIGAGIFAIVALTESRETNLSLKERIEASQQARDESGQIGGESGSAAAPGAAPTPAAEAGELPTKPDFEFFIPLSILVLAASTLAAFRVEAAREHHEMHDRLATAEREVEGQREVEEEEIDANVEAGDAERAVLQELATHIEQERNLLGVWLARYETEYARFCAASSSQPRSIRRPRLPDTAAILLQILRPLSSRQPASEGDRREAEGLAEGAATNGGGPDPDGDRGGDGGPEGGANRNGDRGPGEPPPPPPPERPTTRQRGRFDETGRPANSRWRHNQDDEEET